MSEKQSKIYKDIGGQAVMEGVMMQSPADEAIAIAVNPGETDVISSCTIGTEDFLKLIVKAGL